MDVSTDPLAALRQRSYVVLLVLAALIGAPAADASYWFPYLVNNLQHWISVKPVSGWFGFQGEPLRWPLPVLALAGIVVALPGGRSLLWRRCR